MPSSRRPSQPSTQEQTGAAPRRVRRQPTRSQEYSVAHLPRHVVPAMSQEDEADSGMQANRQAKIKRRLHLKRRLTPWEMAGFAASCVACAFLLPMITSAQADLRQIRHQVAQKETQFRALDKQNKTEKNHLAHLKSEKGREQLLAERGYVRPGDRILLFPTDKEKVAAQ